MSLEAETAPNNELGGLNDHHAEHRLCRRGITRRNRSQRIPFAEEFEVPDQTGQSQKHQAYPCQSKDLLVQAVVEGLNCV